MLLRQAHDALLHFPLGLHAKAALCKCLQGYQPRISIHQQSDLKLLHSLQPTAEYEYTAVALSDNGELLAVCSGTPELQLSVWHWRKVMH
jgi:hypothetical protein